MHKRVDHPEELKFLAHVLADRSEQYRGASWLKTSFESDVWTCEFPDVEPMEIDFNVELNDGQLLTHSKHRGLLEVFKCWLCVRDHFDATGGMLYSGRVAQVAVRETLHVIDWFLLHSVQLNLAQHGLEAITANDLKELLSDLGLSYDINTCIYQWPTRLEQFLRAKIRTMTSQEVNAILQQQPALVQGIPRIEDRLLGLSDDEIIASRAWLWANKFYRYQVVRTLTNRPNTGLLSSIIYRHTLAGKAPKATAEELNLGEEVNYEREYPAVPCKAVDGDVRGTKSFERYRATIRLLGLLEEIQLPIPSSALHALDDKSFLQSLHIKRYGRYRALPQQVVTQALRNAIEFALEYGDDLVKSFGALVAAAQRSDMSYLTYMKDRDISSLLTTKLRKLGIRKWTIHVERRSLVITGSVHETRSAYFKQLRANEGLCELLRVLYGCVYICLGTLMARRRSELSDLQPGSCLDRDETHLIFFNAKSGVGGKREKIARPIPKVAVRMIKQLEALQNELISLGVLKSQIRLFSSPKPCRNQLMMTGAIGVYGCVDIFCDYFEVPRNRTGQRYYIRQHQLRRSFAMLFFWGSGFGGMDTLRWFLGHTDLQHLYSYITESTPGEVLRAVKAQYAGERVLAHGEDAESLRTLVRERYGTRELSVLDSDELDQYIEELMIEGRVTVEPEFLDTPQGEGLRILIKTSPAVETP